jgi:hypothetical protein
MTAALPMIELQFCWLAQPGESCRQIGLTGSIVDDNRLVSSATGLPRSPAQASPEKAPEHPQAGRAARDLEQLFVLVESGSRLPARPTTRSRSQDLLEDHEQLERLAGDRVDIVKRSQVLGAYIDLFSTSPG